MISTLFQCIFDFFDNKELRFPVVTVFEKFKDDDRKFKSSLINDQGMLNLHEAAHFAIHGEDILDEALAFTATQLRSMAPRVSTHLAEEINHTLKFPIRKTVPRYETRFFLSTYARDNSHNKTLLKFAKLDYNILKVRHQKQKQLSDILIALETGSCRLTIAMIFLAMCATKENFDWFCSEHKIIRAADRIARLLDDKASHRFEQKRGHVPSAVECYMKQHGVSEDVAVEFLLKQVADAWKDVNEAMLKPTAVPLPLLEGTQYFEVSTSVTVNVNKAGKL
ncbi:hypothetical protein Pint_04286 [Pistacia integerrima]|uniref:Uncharacterized protein n=1 Tax=Pistacia integerrima TaxID=434235 RepID=A0ACC0Z585_9ROSI|nr:hypothetical protein Pint_04286 [Pistacia integerrima]